MDGQEAESVPRGASGTHWEPLQPDATHGFISTIVVIVCIICARLILNSVGNHYLSVIQVKSSVESLPECYKSDQMLGLMGILKNKRVLACDECETGFVRYLTLPISREFEEELVARTRVRQMFPFNTLTTHLVIISQQT